ncbi:hypothetical protein JDN40_02335, partial [Rhodomicrobium vannielii ATCC 17100]|uniref:hypothetical protein n=1 Tax=Rhodomicrobium vannielii TaxID=1069 RepID=UPI0019180EA5
MVRSPLLLALALTMVAGNAFAACSGPSGTAGDVAYNGDYATMQFCNGTSWISMAASVITESDPHIGTLTGNNFCTSNAGGTQIVCTTSAIPIANISATGTPSTSTYLRGDGSWASVSTGL